MKYGVTVLAVTSAAVTVLALEGTVRLAAIAPANQALPIYAADPLLPFRHAPRARAVSESPGEFRTTIETNEQGFRDFERGPRTGVNRVLVIGDSFTLGAGAEVHETYVARLEQLLSRKRRVEVLNWGISRFFPQAERQLFEHYGLLERPSIVIVGFLPFDLIDTYVGAEAVVVTDGYLTTRSGARLGSPGRWLFANSHVARILISRYTASGDRFPPTRQIYQPDGAYEPAWKRIESEYGRLIALARANQVRVVVVHIPQAGPWTDEHSYPARRLQRFCEREGCAFVDALPAMRAAAGRQLYWPKDGHCTPEGYDVIAHAIRPTIEALLTTGFSAPKGADVRRPPPR
jgi:hypothetical protein